MNEKDENELDIPNFGDVKISDIEQEEATKLGDTKALNIPKNSLKTNGTSGKSIPLSMEETSQEQPTPTKETEEIEQVKAKPKTPSTTKGKTTSVKKPPVGKTPVSKKQTKGKRKPNYLVIASMIVIAIPCLVLLYIIMSSHETKGEPVVGTRFDESLTNTITDEDISAIENALQFETTDSISVNLKSATLRINLDTQDDLSQQDILALMNQAYDIVIEKLPVETYFTNQVDGETTVKMYDLEVSAYNFIPETQEDKANQIHISRTKNAAAESDVVDVLSSAKNAETSEGILNPDTSTPPVEEGDAKGE